MRTRQRETLDVIDSRPLVDAWSDVTCDKCGADGDIFIYFGDELCVDCLLERLIDEHFIEPVPNGYCSDCDREEKCYRYGGADWCAACLTLELIHNGVIAEIF